MAHLRGHGRHVDVLTCDVLEQRKQVDFLLVIAAERSALLLADDRHDGLMIRFSVVESVQKMDRAGAGGREAHTDFSRELRVRARHEGRELFMPRLHELDRVGPAERTHDAVDAVTGITEHAPHAPGVEALEKEVADCGCHEDSCVSCTREMPHEDARRVPRPLCGPRGPRCGCSPPMRFPRASATTPRYARGSSPSPPA